MDRAEATGKNVNEAIENALLQLGKKKDDVDIQVVTEGSRGILGLGSEDARVIATVRATTGSVAPSRQRRMAVSVPSLQRHPAPAVLTAPAQIGPVSTPVEVATPAPVVTAEAEPLDTIDTPTPPAGHEPPDQALVDTTVEVVEELLRLMGIAAETEVRSLDFPLTINVTGDDLGVLIGRRGDTLNSLQFITNLIVGRRLKRWTRIVVDVEDYRLRREHALRDLAAKAADRVRRFRQSVTLEAMPPNERRIVHLALEADRAVSTHSIGIGDDRRVVISPRAR